MADTNTGGGAAVGRDASAGHDFIGRDRYSGDAPSGNSRVEIHNDAQRPSGYSDSRILDDLRTAILGNPYNLGEPGILKSIADLSASMAGFHAWRTAADVERANLGRDVRHYQEQTKQRLDTTTSRLTTFMVIVWVTVIVVGIEAVALIWLFIRLSA